MHACRANLSPIFGVYPEPRRGGWRRRARCAPRRRRGSTSSDGGQRHRVWRLTDAGHASPRSPPACATTKRVHRRRPPPLRDGAHLSRRAPRRRRHRPRRAAQLHAHVPVLDGRSRAWWCCRRTACGAAPSATTALGAVGAALRRSRPADAATVLARLAAAREPRLLGVRTPTRTGVCCICKDLGAVDRAAGRVAPDHPPSRRHRARRLPARPRARHRLRARRPGRRAARTRTTTATALAGGGARRRSAAFLLRRRA